MDIVKTTGFSAVRPYGAQSSPAAATSFSAAAPTADSTVKPVSQTSKADGDKAVARMRLWALAEGGGEDKQLAVSPAFDDPGNNIPRLAAWHVGMADRAVAVAVAVEGQPARLWDIAGDRLNAFGPVAPFNDTVAFLPGGAGDRGTLVTGSFRAPGARVQRWRLLRRRQSRVRVAVENWTRLT